jgi:phage recombination protein Bet
MASKAIQPHVAGGVTERTRAAWSEEQINLIASTVAEGASRAQLYMFLELAARYDLDPFAKEIWCAVPKAQDGAPRRDKVMIMVGRDGFLKIAQRHPDYRGMDSDVVREGDDFSVERVEEGKRLIVHKYGRERGKPIAAYAVVYRDGRLPTYFHAAIEDFRPASPNSNTQWAKGPGPMILKCAEASALRRAFSISGIVAEEEVARDLEAGQAIPVPEPDGPPEVVDRIRSLFDQARLLDQDAYTPAKQRLMLAGASAERLEQIEQELRTFIVAHGGVVAETVTDVTEEPDGPDYEPTEPQPEGVDDDGSPIESEQVTPEQVESMNATLALPVEESDPLQAAMAKAAAAHGIDLSDEEDVERAVQSMVADGMDEAAARSYLDEAAASAQAEAAERAEMASDMADDAEPAQGELDWNGDPEGDDNS